MTSLKKKILSLLTTGAVLLLFQNCGKGLMLANNGATSQTSELESVNDPQNNNSNPNLDGNSNSNLNENNNSNQTTAPQIVEKVKCTFSLTGSGGFQWVSERYVEHLGSCESERSNVQNNNPNATISSIVETFVVDSLNIAEKWKCVFDLVGPNGYSWQSERYVADQADCIGNELNIVQNNNPQATVSVTPVYVHDDTPIGDKWKCSYTMTGSGGFSWTSERYTLDENSCNSTELDIVRQNNPNASIEVLVTYVYDPF